MTNHPIPNLTAFEQAYKFYPATEIPFLQKQKAYALEAQPYRGIKVLHNIPITLESLFKIEVLIASGANLTVTNPSFMQPKPQALEILRAAGVNLQLDQNFQNDYDIALDCCGELLNKITPRIGTAEITRTGALRYAAAELDYPVISIDDSKIKYLEAVLGTGEAFVRAFQTLTGKALDNKKVMVVGYGKVGQGIVNALLPKTQNIVVVDSHPQAVEDAQKRGLLAICASNANEVERQAVSCFAVVTATGREQAISRSFNPLAVKGRYLANMGGEDEFGDEFHTHEVMCEKQPINFAISQPTLIRYLDPVFYAHNLAIELLGKSKLQPTVNPFPVFIAEEVVAAWERYFQESLTLKTIEPVNMKQSCDVSLAGVLS